MPFLTILNIPAIAAAPSGEQNDPSVVLNTLPHSGHSRWVMELVIGLIAQLSGEILPGCCERHCIFRNPPAGIAMPDGSASIKDRAI